MSLMIEICFIPMLFPRLQFERAELSSVASGADLRTGGPWFDPRLGQYSFQGLMIFIATGFIPLSPVA